MSFEYFNTGHLAFGSKLTRAFRQLEKLCNDAENNIAGYVKDISVLGQYVNRNYLAPFPSSANSAVRAREIFDVINDNYYIKEAVYEDGIFRLAVNYYNRTTDRFTIAAGSTSIKKGYAYCRNSVSNSNPASIITFSEEENNTEGRLLFKYRIDNNNFINIEDGTTEVLSFKIGNMDKINNIAFGNVITLPYTADDYCCVAVFGNNTGATGGESVSVSVNGTKIYSSVGGFHKNTCFVNLKPNDVLSANPYAYAKFIDYSVVNTNATPDPEPTPEPIDTYYLRIDSDNSSIVARLEINSNLITSPKSSNIEYYNLFDLVESPQELTRSAGYFLHNYSLRIYNNSGEIIRPSGMLYKCLDGYEDLFSATSTDLGDGRYLIYNNYDVKAVWANNRSLGIAIYGIIVGE